MKIRKGDNVKVIAGKDKGKSGTVSRAFPKAEKVLIEGVNTATRHQKNRRTRSQGQIIEKSTPIHVSNVALIENETPTRAGYKTEDGKKTRISRKTGKQI